MDSDKSNSELKQLGPDENDSNSNLNTYGVKTEFGDTKWSVGPETLNAKERIQFIISKCDSEIKKIQEDCQKALADEDMKETLRIEDLKKESMLKLEKAITKVRTEEAARLEFSTKAILRVSDGTCIIILFNVLIYFFFHDLKCINLKFICVRSEKVARERRECGSSRCRESETRHQADQKTKASTSKEKEIGKNPGW